MGGGASSGSVSSIAKSGSGGSGSGAITAATGTVPRSVAQSRASARAVRSAVLKKSRSSRFRPGSTAACVTVTSPTSQSSAPTGCGPTELRIAT
ncbi:MAG: hypothetical protein U0841_24290 [Chloroflexia bacterium]